MKKGYCRRFTLLIAGFIPVFLILHSTPALAARSDVETFVTRFYQQCLSRNPDIPGLNGWVDALINGSLCGDDVAYGFIFSEEFTNRNTSNAEFLTILYRAFFGREPDSAGYSGWINSLNSGASREDVLNGFINSQEFFNLCASYGINPTSSGDTNTGGTGQAIITGDTALSFIGGSYGIIDKGSAINPLRSLSLNDETQNIQPNPIRLTQIVENTVKKKIDSDNENRPQYRAVYTDSATVAGVCGGSAYITLSLNDITGNFSGNITYNNYCESGVTISGGAGISGQIDTITGDLLKLTITFNNLTGVSYLESASLNGCITADVTRTPAYVLMNLVARDNYTGKTYRAENFTIALWDYGYYGEFNISGRLYDPAFGYVTISTPVNFTMMSYSSYPHRGEMVIYGGNGTKARLTAISSSYCIVEADTDGNGTYEWNSGTLMWSQL